MPRVSSPVCTTYALPVSGWPAAAGDEAIPWNFEEPCPKRPRLAPELPGNICDDGPSCISDAFADAASERAASRWLTNFGELPAKRVRRSLSAAWEPRTDGSFDAHQGLPTERSGASRFTWGPLPATPMVTDHGPAAHWMEPPVEVTMQGATEATSDRDLVGALGSRSAGGGAGGPSSCCTALVPYLGPSLSGRNFRHGLMSTFRLAEPVKSALASDSLTLSRIPVSVSQVVVDELGELRSVVVPISQAPLASWRLGHGPQAVPEFKLVSPGLVEVPIRPINMVQLPAQLERVNSLDSIVSMELQ